MNKERGNKTLKEFDPEAWQAKKDWNRSERARRRREIRATGKKIGRWKNDALRRTGKYAVVKRPAKNAGERVSL